MSRLLHAIRTHLDSLDGPVVVGSVLGIAGVAWIVVGVWRWITLGPHLDDTDTPRLPVPRLSSEWDRLQNYQAQARADIALERGDFAQWEAEVSS